MNRFKISIVIPTYNVEKYIARCLQSCITQKYCNYEIIIIDDCGTDKSIEVVKKFQLTDNRIKIINNCKNLGTYHSRRVGVNSASGDYVFFLDPDDELTSNSLELLNNHLNSNYTDIIFYDVEFSKKSLFFSKKIVLYPKSLDGWVLNNFYFQGRKRYLSGTPGKIYRRDFIKKIYAQLDVPLDYRFVYAEDIFLLLGAMLNFPSYSILPQSLYKYYSNPTSITMSESQEQIRANIEQYTFFLKTIIQYSELIELSKEDKRIFETLITRLKSDLYLQSRYLTNTSYLKSLYMSFKLKPDLSQVFRVLIYIVSLKKLKL